MRTIDSHCDALYKLFLYPEASFEEPHPHMDTRYDRLAQAGMVLQFFALWVPHDPGTLVFQNVLRYVDLFMQKIVSHPRVVHVRTQQDLLEAMKNNRIGALLALEGVDALQGDLGLLRILHALGLRSVGMTWNPANWAADGAGETRNAGLTKKGRLLVQECERLNLLMDVSHLSERGFWDMADMREKSFFASHSNAYSICPHPRNLKDDQIQEIIRRHGIIGLTFVPMFVKPEDAQLSDLLRHLDYIGSLGGADVLALGSDFDGIEDKIPGLEHAGQYPYLYEELLKRYTEPFVQKLFCTNWESYLMRELPKN